MIIPFLFIFAQSAHALNHPSAENLSEKVKKIVSVRSCAHCHTPGLPTTRSRALQVFDLSRDDWYSTMSHKQLSSFQYRLFVSLSPEEARELGGGTPDPSLTDEERSTILSFVLEQNSRR
jgi:hypothetical protein